MTFNIRKIVKFSLMALSVCWVALSTIYVFVLIRPMTQVYLEQHHTELARCRKQPTSDAKYQCTSKLMLSKDHNVFAQVLLVLGPPFGLLIGYWGVGKLITRHHERIKSQHARGLSQQRMAEWRSHLSDMRSSLEAQQKAAARAGRIAAKSSESPPPRARKQRSP